MPLKNYYYDEVVKSFPKVEGKRIAITGTTTGTGYAAADTLAGLGGELVLFNRSSSRADASLKRLKDKHPQAAITQIDCDLTNFASVRAAAKTYLSMFGGKGLDILANNAGIMAFDSIVTEDGYDIQMQTNHLSHYLLTFLLLPEITIASKQRGEARIVNHSSLARNLMPFSLDRAYLQKTNGKNLGGNWTLPRYKRYQQTKLANSVFSAGLHNLLKSTGSNIKVLTAHPGVAETDLVKNTASHDGFSATMVNLMDKIIVTKQSQYDGALPLLKCIVSDEVQSGEIWGPHKKAWGTPARITPIESRTTDEKAIRMLIEESDAATGIDFKTALPQ